MKKESNDTKGCEKIIDAMNTISSVSAADTIQVLIYLFNENKKLKEENRRLKEDKAENEATYERVIENLRTTIKTYESRDKLLKEQQKTYEIVKTTLGGTQ